MTTCDWCNSYSETFCVSGYYRTDNRKFRHYNICSLSCWYSLNDRINLTKVNSNGLTESEQEEQSKKSDDAWKERIKTEYGSIDNYFNSIKQSEQYHRRLDRQKKIKRHLISALVFLGLVSIISLCISGVWSRFFCAMLVYFGWYSFGWFFVFGESDDDFDFWDNLIQNWYERVPVIILGYLIINL